MSTPNSLIVSHVSLWRAGSTHVSPTVYQWGLSVMVLANRYLAVSSDAPARNFLSSSPLLSGVVNESSDPSRPP